MSLGNEFIYNCVCTLYDYIYIYIIRQYYSNYVVYVVYVVYSNYVLYNYIHIYIYIIYICI